MKLKNASVILSRDADSTTWDAMKRVVSSCRAAGVPIPDDVIAFFGGDVDTNAVSCQLPSGSFAVAYGDRKEEQIITINLTKLPPGSRRLQIVVEE